MPKKTLTSTEIKKMLKGKKLVVGTERTIKHLRLGKINKVILTSNCPKKVQKDIEHYAALEKTEVMKIRCPNEELGVICKKPFAISVLSVLKGSQN